MLVMNWFKNYGTKSITRGYVGHELVKSLKPQEIIRLKYTILRRWIDYIQPHLTAINRQLSPNLIGVLLIPNKIKLKINQRNWLRQETSTQCRNQHSSAPQSSSYRRPPPSAAAD